MEYSPPSSKNHSCGNSHRLSIWESYENSHSLEIPGLIEDQGWGRLHSGDYDYDYDYDLKLFSDYDYDYDYVL